MLAQHPGSISYTVEQGLPSNEVYEIHRDRNGFLWFATDNGVVRFDGTGFEKFHIKDGLSDPVVFGFHETESAIWFRTFSGRLCYFEFNSKKIKTYPHNDKLAPFVEVGFLQSIYVDHDTTLHFTTGQFSGAIRINGQTSFIETEPQTVHIFDIDSVLLYGLHARNATVSQIRIDDHVFPITPKSKSLNYVIGAARVNGKTLISANNTLYGYQGGSFEKIREFPNPVISISVGRNNQIWIGCLNGGVTPIDPNKADIAAAEPVRSLSITRVFEDETGGLWMSTLEQGIRYIPSRQIFSTLVTTNSKIRAVLAHDLLLVGEQSGKLSVYAKGSGTPLLLKTIDFEDPILALHCDGENKIWLSTNKDITILSSDLERLKKLPRHNKVQFVNDKNGDVYGIGGAAVKYDINGTPLNRGPGTFHRAIHISDTMLVLAGRTGVELVPRVRCFLSSLKTFFQN